MGPWEGILLSIHKERSNVEIVDAHPTPIKVGFMHFADVDHRFQRQPTLPFESSDKGHLERNTGRIPRRCEGHCRDLGELLGSDEKNTTATN